MQKNLVWALVTLWQFCLFFFFLTVVVVLSSWCLDDVVMHLKKKKKRQAWELKADVWRPSSSRTVCHGEGRCLKSGIKRESRMTQQDFKQQWFFRGDRSNVCNTSTTCSDALGWLCQVLGHGESAAPSSARTLQHCCVDANISMGLTHRSGRRRHSKGWISGRLAARKPFPCWWHTSRAIQQLPYSRRNSKNLSACNQKNTVRLCCTRTHSRRE